MDTYPDPANDTIVTEYATSLNQFLARYSPSHQHGGEGPPTLAEEDAILAAAPPHEEGGAYDRLGMSTHLTMHLVKYDIVQGVEHAIDRIPQTSATLDDIKCAMQHIAFCLRIRREVYLPWRRRFAATVDLDALLDGLHSITEMEPFVRRCGVINWAMKVGAETDDARRLAIRINTLWNECPYRGDRRQEGFDDLREGLETVLDRSRPRTVPEDLFGEIMADVEGHIATAIGCIESNPADTIESCTGGHLPAACRALLTMLRPIEDAHAASAWAFQLDGRLRALRARISEHRRGGRRLLLLTRDDFMLEAIRMVLWEVEVQLDAILSPWRAAEAAAMALHPRLGHNSALAQLGPDNMELIARYVRGPSGV